MKKRYYIEGIRFIFALIIVYYHITHSNIIPYAGENSVYSDFASVSGWAGAAVEGFLIISGYFLYHSYVRNREKLFVEFMVEKIVRLWPVFAVYTFLAVIFLGEGLQDCILDLAFLRCTGISLNYTGIIWYVAPFFWSTLFLYAILKCFGKGMSTFILALITYLGYVINLNNSNGGLGRKIVYSFLSLGMLRVLCGICLGCLIAIMLEAFKNCYGQKRKSIALTIICSVVEVACFGMLILLFVNRRLPVNNVFVVVVLFSVLFICLLSERGVLSWVLNQPFWEKLGRYTYSIYVMQQLAFFVLGKTLWSNTAFIQEHVLLTLLISTGVCVLMGIIIYHAVEKPAVMLYKRWKHRQVCDNVYED